MKYLLFAIILTFSSSAYSQITGLWEVEKVNVGNETMTPVAKWFLFTEDMRSYSGNGGIENSRGTYIFDYLKSEFLFTDDSGKEDEYGPFSVKTENSNMVWTRLEEGEKVVITLKKVKEKPDAPWDKIVGNWILIQNTPQDDEAEQTIFLRWDRRYIARNGIMGNNRSGVWHIHAHRPELRLISDQGDLNDSAWDLSFDGDTMTWKERDTDQPKILTFKRN